MTVNVVNIIAPQAAPTAGESGSSGDQPDTTFAQFLSDSAPVESTTLDSAEQSANPNLPITNQGVSAELKNAESEILVSAVAESEDITTNVETQSLAAGELVGVVQETEVASGELLEDSTIESVVAEATIETDLGNGTNAVSSQTASVVAEPIFASNQPKGSVSGGLKADIANRIRSAVSNAIAAQGFGEDVSLQNIDLNALSLNGDNLESLAAVLNGAGVDSIEGISELQIDLEQIAANEDLLGSKLASNFVTNVGMSAGNADSYSMTIHVSPEIGQTISSNLAGQVRQVVQNLVLEQKANEKSMKLEIRPPDLGHMTIQVNQSTEKIVAEIVASEVVTAEMLLHEKDYLLEALGDLGFADTQVDIRYGNEQQTNEQGNSGNQQQVIDLPSATAASSETYVAESSDGVDLIA